MSEIGNVQCEDTVQCSFFVSLQKNVNWENLCESVNETASLLCKDYIWHRDEFKICESSTNDDCDLPPHLVSTTCFGDNVEDEWFIAYLVFKLTGVHTDLIVQIQDNDGDFLLIEAADVLPTWANPETTQNRVFIYNGHLHLIPPSIAKLNTPLEISNAIKLITDYTNETKASKHIEEAIWKRIGAYPHKIKELSHRATVTIPVDIAAVLILKHDLISALVNRYCHHDDIDAKKCRILKLDNCVDISLNFSKFQYAMILRSKPLYRFGQGNISSKNKKNEIGIKLSCAFEIIMNEGKKDKFSSKEFKKYLENLSKINFFKGNLEGSKDYNRLLEDAKRYFIEKQCPGNYVYKIISELMSTNKYVELRESLRQNSYLYLLDEESDDWLNVDPGKLDDMFKDNYMKFVQSEDLIKPSVVTSGLNNFLCQSSDYEGVEINEASSIDDSKINFDPDQFFNDLENMLNMVTLNVSDEESSEFGDIEDDDVAAEQQIDQELAAKMYSEHQTNLKDDASIFSNLVNSMKEEGLSGPSSNILRSIKINKSKILDSDDDIE